MKYALCKAIALWSLVGLVKRISSQADPVPFTCQNQTFVVSGNTGQLYRLDETVNPFTIQSIGSMHSNEINNLGFRSSDGLLYAIELTSTGNNGPVIIDVNGNVSSLSGLTGTAIPSNVRYAAGDISADGNSFYIAAQTILGSQSDINLYIINLNNLEVSSVLRNKTHPWNPNVADWAVNPLDGKLYGGHHTNTPAIIWRMDPVTGFTEPVAGSGQVGLSTSSAYGGAWFDSNGHLFLHQNSGTVYEISGVHNSTSSNPPILEETTSAPISTMNDAAHCTSFASASPEISIAKTGQLDMSVVGESLIAEPGDVINYTIQIANPGNVRLYSVSIEDLLLDELTCAVSLPIPTFDPDESIECSAVYIIAQSDIDSGQVQNTASVSGLTIDDISITDTSNFNVGISQVAGLNLECEGQLILDETGDPEIVNPGDLVNYQFTLSNTGNITLFELGFTGAIGSVIDCSGEQLISTLAPGAIANCSVRLIISQADIEKGSIDIEFEAAGQTYNGAMAIDVCEQSTPILQISDLSIKKSGILIENAVGDAEMAEPGDVIDFTFVVRNTGNVSLNDISLEDPLVSNINCPEVLPIAKLVPGDSLECTTTFVISQSEIDSGYVENIVVAAGTTAAGSLVTNQSTSLVGIPQTYSLAVENEGEMDFGDDMVLNPGDKMYYIFKITNTGNMVLSNIHISGLGIPVIFCSKGNPIPICTPGETVTCSGTYIVSQENLNAGRIEFPLQIGSDQTANDMQIQSTEFNFNSIPALGQWGLIILVLFLLILGSVQLIERKLFESGN